MSKRGRPPHPDILTQAEWRVADAIRHGHRNKAIAEALGVSVDAVKFHVANILSKLGMTSRNELRNWNAVDVLSALQRSGPMETGQKLDWTIRQISRSTGDIEAARQFYGETLGLQHLFSVGNMAFYDLAGVRLMVAQDGAAKDESILYLAVDDIKERQKELQLRGVTFSHSAHLVHRHDNGSEEWMAFFQDNDGRPMALACMVPSQPD